MDLDHLTVAQACGAVITVGAVVGVLAAGRRWARPKLKAFVADVRKIRDSILGREPQYDSITGEERVPELPGIGVRMAHIEVRADTQDVRLDKITTALEKVADQTVAISDLQDRVTKLELAAVERVVGKAESIAAYRAIEAAHESHPPAETD